MKLDNFKNRLKQNYNNNKKSIFIVLTIWIIAIVTTLFLFSSSLGFGSTGLSTINDVIELDKGTTIEQTLLVGENTNSFCLNFATYRRKNEGKITVNIVGKQTGTVYYDDTLNVKTIDDNNYHVFDLNEKLDKTKDESLIIKITSTSDKGKSLGINYCNKKTAYSTLKVNGETIEGCLSYRILLKDNDFNRFYKIAITIIISCLSILILWLFLYQPKYEYFFSVLVLTLGLFFMAIISPLSPPDELIHYTYSLQESNYLMGKGEVLDIDQKHLFYISGIFDQTKINNKEAYKQLLNNLNDEYVKSDPLKGYDVILENTYKLPFVPQAIGVALARTLELNNLKVFYAGRLTNLLFYVLCVFICIKNASRYKTFLGIVAALPITIQQAASYSYDAFLDGLCLITVGYFVKWMFSEEKMKMSDFIIALLAAVLVSPLKYIYSILTLVYFLVPYSVFGSKKKKFIYTMILNVPMFYQMLPMLLPRIEWLFGHVQIINAETLDVASSPLYSMKYIASHLNETIMFVLKTIRYQISTWFYGSIGRYLSRMTLILPMGYVISILAALISSIFIKENVSLSIPHRIFIILVCISIALLSLAGMLLSETRIGDEYIGGLQGRYYSPLIPFFLLCFTNNKFNISKKYDKYIIFAYILIFFEIIIYVLSYTFIN